MNKLKSNMWLIPYAVGYLLWAVFYIVNPLHYDMFVMKTDYYIRHASFFGVLKAVFFTGGCWKNARYLVNIINIYFVSYQRLFDLVMPLVFVLSIYFSQSAINKEKKWYIALGGLGLFYLVSDGIVGGCYSYSYVLYNLPILFVSTFLLINCRYNDDENALNAWYKRLGYILLVYCCACFNEHLSCAFSVIMIWVLYKDFVINKRKNKTILVATLVSLGQTIYMNMYLIIKQTRPLAQNGNQFLEIIKSNFRIVILETWVANPIIVTAFLLALVVAMRKKRWWFILDSSITIIYLIWFSLIYSAGGMETVAKRTADVIVPYVPKNLWWLWMIIYIVINLCVLWQLFFVSETVALAFFAGGCSTVPIMVTPNTGWSISAIYVFMIILSTVMLFQKEEYRAVSRKAIGAFCTICFIAGCLVLSGRIGRIATTAKEMQDIVDETVRAQIDGEWCIEEDTMVLPHFDARDVAYEGRPDANSYYMWNYCYANGLDKKTIIVTK